MITAAIRSPGFAEPVSDAQRVFRAVLEALARPTEPQVARPGTLPPGPLGAMAGAVVLTLCDEQTPIWIDTALRETDDVETWIRFHTGASIVEEAADAQFCVVSSPSAMPSLTSLRQGSDEEPHLSATVIVDAVGATPSRMLRVTGPGVNGEIIWNGAGLPSSPEFLAEWTANTRRHPRGVDVILAGDGEVRAVPRTSSLSDALLNGREAKETQSCT